MQQMVLKPKDPLSNKKMIVPVYVCYDYPEVEKRITAHIERTMDEDVKAILAEADKGRG